MEIAKVALIGIIGVLLAMQFKSQKAEYSLYIGFAVSLIIFAYAVQLLQVILGRIEALQIFLEGSGAYLGTLLKVVGITYLCEFAAGVCKDAVSMFSFRCSKKAPSSRSLNNSSYT